jgi:hypothetical protein
VRSGWLDANDVFLAETLNGNDRIDQAFASLRFWQATKLVETTPQPPKRASEDTLVRLPMNMLAKFDEENSPSFANALIRRDDEVATLPWPVRAINTGLSQATKPVIQWSQGPFDFRNELTSNRTAADSNVGSTNVGVSSVDELETPSKETKPNRWLSEFLKRFSLKR